MNASTQHPVPKALIAVFLSVLLIPLFGGGAARAQAQGPIRVEVDRPSLSTGETLLLTVTVDSLSILGAPRPVLPALEGFDIAGSSSSSQISITNGDIASRAVYVYRLQPYETGDLVIGPIEVTIDGQAYSTNPIAIHVTQGASSSGSPAQPAASPADLAGQDLFVEAEVDDPAPYVGQQVTYTFRFYQAAELFDQPQYQAPTFTGFWSEDQAGQHEARIQAAGRVYRVTELQTILFPSIVGPLTIEPARLVIPGGFFRAGQTLQTRPVELDVRPLPPGAPAGFQGAVGRFTLAASLDSAQGTAGEPLTWQVTLSGEGNLTAAPDPAWPDMPGWRDFESEAAIHTEVRDGRLVGSRTYERLLVPGAPGVYTVPALAYVYFDPQAGTYETIRTEPVPVRVAPGSGPAAPSLPSVAAPATIPGESAGQVPADIRHLKPVPASLAPAGRPVTQSALYWAAWAFPVLGLAGYAAWQRRQRYWEDNLGLARSAQARKKARQALAQARRQRAAAGQGAYAAAGQILNVYLADKLDRPVAGLTHRALADLLAGQGVSATLIERVEVIRISSELGRFAPGTDDPSHARSLLGEVGRLVDALEKVF